jgi:hypothetical protein
MKIFLTTALFTMALATGVPGQTTPAAQPPAAGSEPTFKAGGEEVVLDVVVREKKGKLAKPGPSNRSALSKARKQSRPAVPERSSIPCVSFA